MNWIFIVLLALVVCLYAGCKKDFRANVREESDRIHKHIQDEAFAKIYEEASPRIRECHSLEGFSERIKSLVETLKAVDPQLGFRQASEETRKSDMFNSSSDQFIEGVYTVGAAANNFREVLVFRNEDGKLKLFAYRVFNRTEKIQDVRATMIACAEGN